MGEGAIIAVPRQDLKGWMDQISMKKHLPHDKRMGCLYLKSLFQENVYGLSFMQ